MMKKKEYCSLGIMSGTSLDGLDFSLLKTDGKENINPLINEYSKFNTEFRSSIKGLIKKFNTLDYKLAIESREFVKFNKIFTEDIYCKIKEILKKHSIDKSSLDVIGLHGNTLIHNPEKGLSLQLGDAKLLSEKLQITVISKFREKDISKNGQGAPLVPIFHLYKFSEPGKNIMIVNIGGISNFSLIVNKQLTLASDIGPGNKLIDEFCSNEFNRDFDEDGKISIKGQVIENLIEIWKKSNFCSVEHPISFDNSFFNLKDFVKLKKYKNHDYLRSLTFFSAFLISNVEKKIKHKVDKWIFCGGGTANSVLMKDLKGLIGENKVFITKDYGLDPFFVESQAFAFISVRTMKGLPSSYPQTTGCEENCVCGVKFFPD